MQSNGMRFGQAFSEEPRTFPRDMFHANNLASLHNKRAGGEPFASVTVNLISHSKDNMDDGNGTIEESDAANADQTAEENEDDAIVEEDEEELEDGTSFASSSSSAEDHIPRLPNIFIPCTKCRELINVCRLQSHRNLHSALKTFQFSHEQRPTTIKALVKRRRLLITRLQETSGAEGKELFGDKQLYKLNTTFEILKNDIEGSTDQLRVYDGGSEVPPLDSSAFHVACTRAVGLCAEANKQWKHMEDTHCYQDEYLEHVSSSFFAVYDGYRGENTAKQCAKHLHVYLKEELQDTLSQKHIEKRQVWAAFRRAYFRVEKILLLNPDQERLHSRWSGCSAVTCVLTPSVCYLANVGDVGAILIRCNDVVKVLTRKHDLYDKKERARVRKFNGVIVKSEKSALINGALGVTRGIGNLGDGGLKSCIINEPQVKCVPLDPADQVLVMASSGFWKIFDYEEMAYLVNGFMSQVKEEAKRNLLEKLSMRIADTESEESSDGETGETGVTKPMKRVKSCPCVYSKRDGFYGNNDVTNRVSRRNKSYPCLFSLVTSFHGDNDVSLSSPLEGRDLGRECRSECESLCMSEKEQLLARKLAERLVKSALLAGSMDNVTVMAVLLPGFSLVPWYAVTSRVLDNLDTPAATEEGAWPRF